MKRTLLVVGLMILAVGLLANAVLAAEEEAKVKVTGTVTVTKNDEGGVTAVAVKAGDTVTKLVLDDNGKKVAEMAGKKVEVVAPGRARATPRC